MVRRAGRAVLGSKRDIVAVVRKTQAFDDLANVERTNGGMLMKRRD